MKPAAAVVDEVLAGADGDCVVIVEESSEAEVRFANNTTTTNGVRLDRRVTVVSFKEVSGGTAVGVARRGGEVDAADLAAAAARDALDGPAADDASPPPEGGADPGWTRMPVHTDLGALSGVLSSLSGAFGRAGREGRVLSGFAEHRLATTYLGTTAGIRRRHLQPTSALHLVARSDDGRRSAWAGSADLDDDALGSLEDEVVRGLGWAQHTVDLPPGRYRAVLPPAAVADLMVAVAEAAGGREAEEGRTVFSAPDRGTRIGERLSPLPCTLWSDPGEPGLGCIPFLATATSGSDVSVFDNGLPLSRVDWIEDGALRRLRYHRAGARRAGVDFTPPVDNLGLTVDGATGTVDDLVASTERGLLLTCLWYIREVDPATLLLTGLTRDGVYVIEDGRVIGAANNFRFNESPVDVLARATVGGAPVRTLGREFGEWVNRTRMPPLVVPDFNMSSVSEAR